jgi:hypothetical protein
MISRSITAVIACTALATACSSPTGTNPPDDGTVASVVVSPTTLTFDALGVTEPLTAVVRNADGDVLQNNVTWSVPQGNAVSVSTSGVVTAVSNGTATVRASAGGVTTDVAVTVSQVPVSISAADCRAP